MQPAGSPASIAGLPGRVAAATATCRPGWRRALDDPGCSVIWPIGTFVENLVIDRDVVIERRLSAPAILDGGGVGRVITILGGTVKLRGLVVQNGYAEEGAGIYNAGTLRLESVKVTDNISDTTDDSKPGGGLYSVSNLSVDGSIFLNNSALVGGGIAASGVATIEKTIIEYNTASLGGGIWFDGNLIPSQQLRVITSEINNNTASIGGGIATTHALAFELRESAVTQNHSAEGGGLYLNRTWIDIVNSTISDNVATGSGGGLATISYAGKTWLYNTTVTRNSAGGEGGGIYMPSRHRRGVTTGVAVQLAIRRAHVFTVSL